jgi:hypothetical protein
MRQGTSEKDVEFVLLAEAGILEAQALLLCESIRTFAGVYAQSPITVISPRRDRRPSPLFARALERLGAEYWPADVESCCPQYGTSYRVHAAALVERRAGPAYVVQLDSDTLFVGRPDFAMAGHQAAGRPVDVKGMCTAGPDDPFDEYWKALCRCAGVDLDDVPFLETGVDRIRVRASYNGGLLVAERAAGIFARTEEIFRKLVAAKLKPWMHGPAIRTGTGLLRGAATEYWGTSQAAFSLATVAGNHAVRLLPQSHNVPLNLLHKMAEPISAPPVHLHYHGLFTAGSEVDNPVLSGRLELPERVLAWLRPKLPLVATNSIESRSSHPATTASAMQSGAAVTARRIVVLGMHRSGTSATTALIASFGAYVGQEDELTGGGPENPLGFFERKDVRRSCDAVLQSVGADWWKVSGFDPSAVPEEAARELGAAVARLDSHGTWVLKEPRLCLLLPLIRPYVDNCVFVFVARNPVEVARSLHRRNGIPRHVGLALWEAYCTAALRDSKSTARIIVNYRDLVERPAEEAERLRAQLRAFGIEGLSSPRSVAIAPALRHERSTDDEFAELASDSQRALWAAICAGEPDRLPLSLSPGARMALEDYEQSVQRSGDAGVQRRGQAPQRAAEADSDTVRIPLAGYDFVDFGCGAGGSMEFAQRALGGRRGLGIDANPDKVGQSITRGYDAVTADITQCRFVGDVSFALMSHFLEHLTSFDHARQCIERAVACARDFVLVQQPYFDANGQLFERGFKLAWSDWHGHRTHLSAIQLHSIASNLQTKGRIARFVIGRRMRIRDSSDPWVHPLQSPPDQHAWSVDRHPAKNHARFDFAVFRELFLVIFPVDPYAQETVLGRYMSGRDGEVLFDSLGERNVASAGPDA